MSPFIQKFLLLCVLMLLSIHNIFGVHANGVNSVDHLFRHYVNVFNTLEGNLDLTLHCKSADDDLGVHLLHHGEVFSWNFKPTLFGTTQFYCSFVWNNELHWFDIYIHGDDGRAACDYCNWNIYKSGPCRIQEPESPVQTPACYPWNKN